ncbi:MAG: N-acetylmuramoyl-L-alanine amidase [Deltaproteobacteria bacterium]|nr:N-acetylmuramoyl-L-alanine amidase [Deltaproteobacteria bacterium]
MTRLIVELSEPVEHHIQRQQREPIFGVPERVAIDFPGTRLDPAAKLPGSFAEGPAVRLRAARTAEGAVRLLVDVPGLSDVGTFFLPDPYRLIVDLRGTPRLGKPRPVPTPTRQLPAFVAPRSRTPELRAARPSPLPARRRLKIVLDPGHGGKDPGAFGVGGIAEKDIVLAIAKRLRDRLADEPDLDVVLTRDSDVFLRLEERTALANAEHADLFLSIHGNASTNANASGAETYYLNNTDDHATLRLAAMENGLRSMTGQSGDSSDIALILSDLIQNYKVQEAVRLAQEVQNSLVASVHAHGADINDLGVKRGPFYVLVGAGMPGALVEVSFLTNPEEGRRLADPLYQDAIADGLLRGLRRSVEGMRSTGNL